MKYIQKSAEPCEFAGWKDQASDDWQPAYNSMGNRLKTIVKKALMREQGYLCCYCERRLTQDDSHIEHFVPQSLAETDPLDYSNMLCSCQNRLKKGEPRHCGNLKGQWFDPERLISPLEPGCENRFRYLADGKIKPLESGDDAAQCTIKKLGLDIPKLNDLRKKAIEPFLDDVLSDDELKIFVSAYLQPDQEGALGAFYMTIKLLFGAYLEQ